VTVRRVTERVAPLPRVTLICTFSDRLRVSSVRDGLKSLSTTVLGLAADSLKWTVPSETWRRRCLAAVTANVLAVWPVRVPLQL
jgi:hypothetical protein